MKRLAVLLLMPLLALCSCTYEERPDFERLSQRLALVSEDFGFEYFDMFISDGAYCVYLDVYEGGDALLTLHLSESLEIEDLCLTARSQSFSSPEARARLKELVLALMNIFVPDEAGECAKALALTDEGAYFTVFRKTHETSNYRFISSGDELFFNFYLEYYESISARVG